MKTKTLLLLLLCLSANGTRLWAQNLSEKMGAIPTQFEIFSDTFELSGDLQFLIKRDQPYVHSNFEYSYAYSYSTWQLEFISRNAIVKRGSDRRGRQSDFFRLEFFTADRQRIATTDLNTNQLQSFRVSLSDNRFIHVIDLNGIPITLLDRTQGIVITRYPRGWDRFPQIDNSN